MFLKMILGFALSLGLTLILMPKLIAFLHKVSYKQSVSEYSLDSFKQKAKTPTMGGVGFVIIPIIALFIIYPKAYLNYEIMILIFAYLAYGLIGFIDDFIIVIKKNNKGLKASYKFLMQLVVAMVFYYFYKDYTSTDVIIPFVKIVLPLGSFYAIFAFIMFTAESNAVNLTDGMDGLAAGTSFLAFSPFVLFAVQMQKFEVATLILCIMGSLLGYLKFNVFPAKIFMGDTGSLALGGFLAACAMVLKQELALLIIGGVFLWETLCVVIQISSVKLFKRRVFKYTPIHYSFVISGMKEQKVVLMFWMIGAVFAILGFVIGVI